MRNWSSRLSKQYQINLSADVVAWFDGELWKKCSQTGFGQPIEPAQLLDPTSSALLGGLMLPDTLPILDNGCGDALCLRFNLKGTVSEVVRWEHEGGNWTPFGTSLCEALLLDAALTLMEEPQDDGELRLEDIGYAGWALEWLEGESPPSRIRQVLIQEHALPIMGLLEAGVAETAVRRVLLPRLLHEWVAKVLPRVRRQLIGHETRRAMACILPVVFRYGIDSQRDGKKSCERHTDLV